MLGLNQLTKTLASSSRASSACGRQWASQTMNVGESWSVWVRRAEAANVSMDGWDSRAAGERNASCLHGHISAFTAAIGLEGLPCNTHYVVVQ